MERKLTSSWTIQYTGIILQASRTENKAQPVNDGIELAWNKIENNIIKAATNALRKRRINKHNKNMINRGLPQKKRLDKRKESTH